MGVFDEQNSQEVTPPVEKKEEAAPNVNDIWAEKLKTITREDGTPKYNTVEDALEAIAHQNKHITDIEAENRLLAEKAKEAQTLKETLERLGNKVNEEKPNGVTPASGGLSEEAAKELVNSVLNNRQQTEAAINNIKTVESTLISKFGNEASAQAAIVAKAKELGVSLKELKEDSARSPKKVLALFATDKPAAAPNTGTINLSRPQPTDPEIKRPDKSILSGRGATDQNQTDLMKQIRERVHKKHGITV